MKILDSLTGWRVTLFGLRSICRCAGTNANHLDLASFQTVWNKYLTNYLGCKRQTATGRVRISGRCSIFIIYMSMSSSLSQFLKWISAHDGELWCNCLSVPQKLWWCSSRKLKLLFIAVVCRVNSLMASDFTVIFLVAGSIEGKKPCLAVLLPFLTDRAWTTE